MEVTFYVAHIKGNSPKAFAQLFDAQKYIVETITSNPSAYHDVLSQWVEDYVEYLSYELMNCPQSKLESLEEYAYDNFEDFDEYDHYCYSLTSLRTDHKDLLSSPKFYFVNFLIGGAPDPKVFFNEKEAQEYVFDYIMTHKSKGLELEEFRDETLHDEYCDYIESLFDNKYYHSAPISIHNYFIQHFYSLDLDDLVNFQEVKIES